YILKFTFKTLYSSLKHKHKYKHTSLPANKNTFCIQQQEYKSVLALKVNQTYSVQNLYQPALANDTLTKTTLVR
ncbi:hypothetical protein PP707_05065, partial [Acetobacter pasteurianus]|nr:hypothetical protein [Acetobacter pasteurianus]